MIKAVIFDCDGVIIDSEPIKYKVLQELFLNEFNIRLPKENLKIEKACMGVIGKKGIQALLKMFKLKGNMEDLLEKRAKIMRRVFSKRKNYIEIKGTIKLIKMLKKNKFKLAIASSASEIHLKKVVKMLKLKNMFSTIVYGKMVKRGKPNPDIFLLSARKLKTTPKECIVVEDSNAGVKAAKRAHMKCIALTTSLSKKELKKAKPNLIANSLKNISLKQICELN